MRKNTLSYFFLLGSIFLGPLPVQAQAESAAAPARMLLMDLRATLIEEDVVRLVNNMLTTELALHEEFELITGSDMRQMVALEADKQSMGCGEDNSCLAELAGAMGARYIVFGEMGKLGSFYLVTLNIFDSKNAKAAARNTLRVKSIDALVEKLPGVVEKLIGQTTGKKAAPSAPVRAASTTESLAEESPKVAKAEPVIEPKPEPAPKAAEPAKAIEDKPPVVAAAETGSSLLVVASGGFLLVTGAASTGFGGWGLAAPEGIMTTADSSKQQREMVIMAYEGAPVFIGAGVLAMAAGGTLLFWPASEKEAE